MITTRPAIEDLSFTAMRDGTVLPPAVDGQLPRCFWNVISAGDYAADALLGRKLAFEYIDFMAADPCGSGILSMIVTDFPQPLTQVVREFMHVVELEMRKGPGGARRVVDQWASMITRLAEDERRETVTTAVRIRRKERREAVAVSLTNHMEAC